MAVVSPGSWGVGYLAGRNPTGWPHMIQLSPGYDALLRLCLQQNVLSERWHQQRLDRVVVHSCAGLTDLRLLVPAGRPAWVVVNITSNANSAVGLHIRLIYHAGVAGVTLLREP
jgi:hypothetical protein